MVRYYHHHCSDWQLSNSKRWKSKSLVPMTHFIDMVSNMTVDFAVDLSVDVCTSGDLLKGELIKDIIDGKTALLIYYL